MPRERDWYITLRREIEDADFLTQCGHWMEKRREQPTGRAYLRSTPVKHRDARSRPISRKKNAGKANERWKPKSGECEIRGRGVRSRTQGLPAVIAAPTRWAAQTLAGANISIGNPRRIAARRKRQTEAPDHKMQDNKGQANQALARKKKRIKWRHGEGEIFEPASCKQQRWKSRCALACSLGVS